MREGVCPYAIPQERPHTAAVQGQGRELNQMEKLGAIAKVTQPTPCCAGMVVVPKKSGDVRICMDLKPLNEGVLQETYPIPPVDDALA